MGTKQSKPSAQSVHQKERERAEKEHREYVQKVIDRKDASSELKKALIDCAEARKELKIVNSHVDLLKDHETLIKSQITMNNEVMSRNVLLYKRMVVSNTTVLIILFIAFFSLYLFASGFAKSNIVSEDKSDWRSNVKYCADTPNFRSPSGEGTESGNELLIVSKGQLLSSLHSYDSPSINGEDIWNFLHDKKERISYLQLFSILQKEILPRITFSLIAATLGVTLISIAVPFTLVAFWGVMSVGARFGSSLAVLLGFLTMGLYMSNIDDAIDLPGGALLALATCFSPVVVVCGFELVRINIDPQARIPLREPWLLLVCAFTVFVLSVLLLHLVSFAPLVVLVILSATFLLALLLDTARECLRGGFGLNDHGNSVSKSLIESSHVLWALSLLAWFNSTHVTACIHASRKNLQYPLVTDVETWFEWCFMLSLFVWYVVVYVHGVYNSTWYTEWKARVEAAARGEYVAAPMALMAAVFGNFTHMMVSLYIATNGFQSASGTPSAISSMSIISISTTKSIVAGAFGHLCACGVACETIFLTIYTVGKMDIADSFTGVAELLFLLNIALVYFSSVYSYSIFMVVAVLNIATYILTKVNRFVQGIFFLVLTLALALLVIMVGIYYKT